MASSPFFLSMMGQQREGRMAAPRGVGPLGVMISLTTMGMGMGMGPFFFSLPLDFLNFPSCLPLHFSAHPSLPSPFVLPHYHTFHPLHLLLVLLVLLVFSDPLLPPLHSIFPSDLLAPSTTPSIRLVPLPSLPSPCPSRPCSHPFFPPLFPSSSWGQWETMGSGATRGGWSAPAGGPR